MLPAADRSVADPDLKSERGRGWLAWGAQPLDHVLLEPF